MIFAGNDCSVLLTHRAAQVKVCERPVIVRGYGAVRRRAAAAGSLTDSYAARLPVPLGGLIPRPPVSAPGRGR